jgi:hypothetical protein
VSRVDHKLIVRRSCGAIQVGAKIIAAGGVEVNSVLDLSTVPVGDKHSIWVVVYDYNTARVEVSQECSAMAQFMASALRQYPTLKGCTVPELLPGCAAADARANSDEAHLGGWWSPSDRPDISEVRWFYVVVRQHEVPQLNLIRNHSRDISFYEALAQVVLAVGRLKDHPNRKTPVVFKQDCDNAAAVGACNKCFTTKAPLCYALQMLTHFCVKYGGVPDIHFIKGDDNVWADRISRFVTYPEFPPLPRGGASSF